jgi:hypothetical protein
VPITTKVLSLNPVQTRITRYNWCDKVYHWLAAGWWFSPDTPVFSTDKTDRHGITENIAEWFRKVREECLLKLPQRGIVLHLILVPMATSSHRVDCHYILKQSHTLVYWVRGQYIENKYWDKVMDILILHYLFFLNKNMTAVLLLHPKINCMTIPPVMPVKNFRTIPLCGNFSNHISRTLLMSESIARFKRLDNQSRNSNWKIISVKEWKCSGNS